MAKMAKMAKNRQRAGDIQNGANIQIFIPKVVPWRVAILASLAKIRQRCSETCNKFLKGAISLVTNLAKKKQLSWVPRIFN